MSIKATHTWTLGRTNGTTRVKTRRIARGALRPAPSPTAATDAAENPRPGRADAQGGGRTPRLGTSRGWAPL